MNDWRNRARCRNVDPELFFPVGDRSGPDREQTAAAQKVCQGCPVRLACLEWAVATGSNAGIWGGLTEAERRPLRRRYLASGVA